MCFVLFYFLLWCEELFVLVFVCFCYFSEAAGDVAPLPEGKEEGEKRWILVGLECAPREWIFPMIQLEP